MPRGMPDWGEYSPQEVVSKLLDNAELAARLGSPVLFDRRGTVIFMDDFNCGVNHWNTVTEGNLKIYPSAKNPFIGGYSLAFYDDGLTGMYPYISISVPFITQSNIGAEGVFSLQNANAVCMITILFIYQGISKGFSLIYDRTINKINVLTVNKTLIPIQSGVSVPVGSHTWFTMKLVVDPVNGKYVRARFNDKTLDLSSYNCYSETSTEADSLYVNFVLGASIAQETTNYLGYAIITQNE